MPDGMTLEEFLAKLPTYGALFASGYKRSQENEGKIAFPDQCTEDQWREMMAGFLSPEEGDEA